MICATPGRSATSESSTAPSFPTSPTVVRCLPGIGAGVYPIDRIVSQTRSMSVLVALWDMTTSMTRASVGLGRTQKYKSATLCRSALSSLPHHRLGDPLPVPLKANEVDARGHRPSAGVPPVPREPFVATRVRADCRASVATRRQDRTQSVARKDFRHVVPTQVEHVELHVGLARQVE